jgi:hypothetical protein
MAPVAAASRSIVLTCPAFIPRPVRHPFQLTQGAEADRTGAALKTASDAKRQLSELPIQEAIDSLSDDQIPSMAETILSQCSRANEQRSMSKANKLAFDKLVAEVHCDIHEMQEIREAIEDYYS